MYDATSLFQEPEFVIPYSHHTFSTPNESRTHNLRIRSALLYPIELWGHINKFGKGYLLFRSRTFRYEFIVCSSIATLCESELIRWGYKPSKASISLPICTRGRTRTGTDITVQGILSPSWLPITPLWHLFKPLFQRTLQIYETIC